MPPYEPDRLAFLDGSRLVFPGGDGIVELGRLLPDFSSMPDGAKELAVQYAYGLALNANPVVGFGPWCQACVRQCLMAADEAFGRGLRVGSATEKLADCWMRTAWTSHLGVEKHG